MLNKASSIKHITLLISLFAVFVVLGLSDLADARSSSSDGIGIFELLILGGLGFFLYKRFVKR